MSMGSAHRSPPPERRTMKSDQRPAPLNAIWLLLVVTATITAAYTGSMKELTNASFESAKSAVTLAIGMVGAMALWLGVMRVVEDAGIMHTIARVIRPLMVRLFPDVPSDHPAMSAMIMNMAANALGLGNAATPMGIKAMYELDKLNPEKGRATNAMCLFLAINTSNVTLLPLGVITIRAAAGATSPASILITSLVATTCSTITAVIVAKLLARRETLVAPAPVQETPEPAAPPQPEPANAAVERFTPGIISKILLVAGLVGFAAILVGVVGRYAGRHGPGFLFSTGFWMSATDWLIPILMCTFLVTGWFNGVKVYESVTEGAKEGFSVAIRIIPYMVAIFVAIGMFRASGAMNILAHYLNFVLEPLGMPADVLPMALMRPLSGSGAFGLMSEIVNLSPDSFSSFLASTLQGSTETTFYVLAVYFGSIGIRKTRHALPAALIADAVGIVASVAICRIMF